MLLWSDPHGPEAVGGAGVTYYPRLPPLSVVLPPVDGAVIAAFSKVLLPRSEERRVGKECRL